MRPRSPARRRPRWRRSSASSTTTPSTATRRLSARRDPQARALPRRPDDPDARGDRLHPGRAPRLRLGRARPAQVPRGRGPQPDRHRGQGRRGLRARPQPAGRRGGDLTALLARLHDRGANREGAEPEADHHRRDRLRPRRSRGRDERGRHRRRGHLLQLDQRLRARRDDDPVAGPQLHPVYQIVLDGGWNIADAVSRSYDVEGMQVGTVAAGRIGSAVLRRLKPFDVGLHYTDRHRLPAEVEEELGVTFHESAADMVPEMDVVTINAPLHPETEHLFDDEMIGRMKRGAYIVNTARGKICDRDAIARALESGQLAGYAGDVWFPQPAPKDHPWRTMPHHGMTPHTSGSSLSAQARYAAGHPRDPRVPLRRPADPRGVPDRPGRRARRRRRALLQRGRRHRRLGGGGALLPAGRGLRLAERAWASRTSAAYRASRRSLARPGSSTARIPAGPHASWSPEDVADRLAAGEPAPTLATIAVGDAPASRACITAVARACEETGVLPLHPQVRCRGPRGLADRLHSLAQRRSRGQRDPPSVARP